MTERGFYDEVDAKTISEIATGLLNSKKMLSRYKKAQQTEDEEDDPTKEIGIRIKIVRELKGMTQLELARKIGASQSLLTNYECGRREVSIKYLLKIARALNVPFSWLLGEPRQ